MAATIVHDFSSGGSGGANPSVTFTPSSTSNVLLVAVADAFNTTAGAPTISGWTSFSAIGPFIGTTQSGVNCGVAFYWVQVQGTGSTTCTYTTSGGDIHVYEISGGDFSCTDGQTSNSASNSICAGTNVDTGTFSTGGSSDVTVSVAISPDDQIELFDCSDLDTGNKGTYFFGGSGNSGVAAGTSSDTFGGQTQYTWAAAMLAISAAYEKTVSVTPSSSTIATNATKQLSASAHDQCGNSFSDTFTWSIFTGGGSVNGSGLYTAPSSPTVGIVQAHGVSGGRNGLATVTVVSPGMMMLDLLG